MTERSERNHLSIGEVLALVQDEFPDVSISKIRFLESQGLIEPQRTPSGYRQFFDDDVARLRWILMEQRDNFLPLKVIRERLDGGEFERWRRDGGVVPGSADERQPSLFAASDDDDLDDAVVDRTEVIAELEATDDLDEVIADAEVEALADAAKTRAAAPVAPNQPDETEAGASATPPEVEVEHPAEPEPAPEPEVDAEAGSEPVDEVTDPLEHDLMLAAARQAASRTRDTRRPEPPPPVTTPPDIPAPVPGRMADGPLDAGPTSVSMTVEELSRSTGLTPAQLGELEKYGLLHSRAVGPAVYYDGDAMVVAKLAAVFHRHGVEARHLRMYKTAAEREAGVFEQVVAPLIRRTDATSRRDARERLVEMARLGEALHAALLRVTLKAYTDPR